MSEENDPENTLLATSLARLLTEANATVSTAESCTGGLLGGALTAISGSSQYFPGGVVCYSNSIKESLLGIAPELITENGAVSGQVAIAMARGVRSLIGTEVGLSVTGIAGPTGATPGKPVGTTFIACVTGEIEEVRMFHFGEDRQGNRALAVRNALLLLKSCLEQ